MPPFDKRDLVVHYDEETQEVIFYSAPVADTADIRGREFDGVRPSVQFFREKAPDEAERVMGGMIFSLLDLCSEQKIGIRNYAEEASAAHAEYVKELELKAAHGDPEAQYFMFIELHGRVIEHGQQSDLDQAERLLKASAAAGYADAQKHLNDSWPFVKAAAERRIARGTAS